MFREIFHRPSLRCLRLSIGGLVIFVGALFAFGVFDYYLYLGGIYHVPPLKCDNCFSRSFKYVMQTTDACTRREDGTFLIIIVASRPSDFQARDDIRKMWGSVENVKNMSIQTVFLLGSNDNGQDLDEKLRVEQAQHNDLIQGDFVDDYRNLTIKSLMGLRWVQEYCSGAKFILKTDSDCFVNVYTLVEYLETVPENQDFVGGGCFVAARTATGKWASTAAEYPYKYFPMYCIGLGYVLSLTTATRIIEVSRNVPYFWIEDIYITGLCRNVLELPYTVISGFVDVGYIHRDVDDCDILTDIKVLHQYKYHSMAELWNMTKQQNQPGAPYPDSCKNRYWWRCFYLIIIPLLLIVLLRIFLCKNS